MRISDKNAKNIRIDIIEQIIENPFICVIIIIGGDSSMPEFTRVMRYELHYIDGAGEFSEMQKMMWAFQDQTREIMNRTIREYYLYEVSKNNYLKERRKQFYHILVEDYSNLGAKIVNETMRKAEEKFKNLKKEIMLGNISLPSFKKGQPIYVPSQCIDLFENENEKDCFFTFLRVTSREYQNEHPGVKKPKFKLVVKDNTQRTILRNILSGAYGVSASQILYDRPKWFLNLTYAVKKEVEKVDPSKVLGVDLGCVFAVYASSFGNFGRFNIPGDEVSAFERKQAAIQGRKAKTTLERAEELEQRRKAKQQQARYCGEGRIGHGTKTRVAAVYQETDKIARFRDTINHRYSRALVDYAVKNGYGVIQMEDLSGIKSDTDYPKRLQHWTYYDLQSKIIYKAEEAGIKVIKVDPRYTSQRCSRCGHIAKENRKTQELFECVNCGFKCNADYNASQNISIPSIDTIIRETEKMNKREAETDI